MKPEVKSFIKREIESIGVTLDSYDQAYTVFDQLVLYDIEVQEVASLRERLPVALNKISSEKIDKEDINTYFPHVWGCFEPYVKMVLYIKNHDKGLFINQPGLKSLLTKGLSLRVTAPSQERTPKIDALYTAYNVRNDEAHVCKGMSYAQSYMTLAKVMAAFLIVTEAALPFIQTAMEGQPKERKIIVPRIVTSDLLKSSIFDVRFLHKLFYNLGDYSSIKRIMMKSNYLSCYEFNQDGWLKSNTYKDNEDQTSYESTHKYNYDKVKDLVTTCVVNNLKSSSGTEESAIEYKYSFEYYDNGSLSRVDMKKRQRPSGEMKLHARYYVDYLETGELQIKSRWYLRDMGGAVKKEKETIYLYSKRGDLLSITEDKDETKYVYSDKGALQKVLYSNNKEDSIKVISDTWLRVRKDDEKEILLEKRLFDERGRVVEIIRDLEKQGKETRFLIEYYG